MTFIDRLAGAASTQPATAPDPLHDVRAFIHRYVRIGNAEATLITLWIATTHILDAFDYVPYLHITSPVPECGKSRLLEVLEALVNNPWLTSRVSAAVLMRKLDAQHPTLLLDESDAQFNGDEEYSEALRGMLNAGFHRSGVASCCVGQGANIAFKDFKVFGAKAVAGIGRLPATVESRSIPIVMKRRLKIEQVQRWRRRDCWTEATTLRERLTAAFADRFDTLREARPPMPGTLSDRAADVLEPLFALAHLAGGEWPAAATEAAETLMSDTARAARAADQNIALELLADIRQALDGQPADDAVFSKTLVDGLVAMEDRPWSAFGHSEKPITQAKMTRLLKRFDIQSAGRVTLSGTTARGFRRQVFDEAFSRYLGSEVSKRHSVNETGPEMPITKVSTGDELTLSKTPVHPDKHWRNDAVTLSNRDHEVADGLAPDFVPPMGISRSAWARHHNRIDKQNS
jgi:hypothetical protein